MVLVIIYVTVTLEVELADELPKVDLLVVTVVVTTLTIIQDGIYKISHIYVHCCHVNFHPRDIHRSTSKASLVMFCMPFL